MSPPASNSSALGSLPLVTWAFLRGWAHRCIPPQTVFYGMSISFSGKQCLLINSKSFRIMPFDPPFWFSIQSFSLEAGTVNRSPAMRLQSWLCCRLAAQVTLMWTFERGCFREACGFRLPNLFQPQTPLTSSRHLPMASAHCVVDQHASWVVCGDLTLRLQLMGRKDFPSGSTTRTLVLPCHQACLLAWGLSLSQPVPESHKKQTACSIPTSSYQAL